MSANCDLATVRRFPGFQNLTEAEAANVTGHLRCQRLAAGQILFQQGERGDVVYLLLAGQLELKLEGAERPLATLEAGAILGEIGFLLSEPRTATATAKTAVELAQLDHAVFETAFAQGESWAQKFLLATAQTLAHRLGTATREVGALLTANSGVTAKPQAKKLAADLESLRAKLFTEWAF
jgi:CRP-like cAMP-binding protein